MNKEIDYNEFKGKTPEMDKVINTINIKKLNGLNVDDDVVLLALMLMEYNGEFEKADIRAFIPKGKEYEKLDELLNGFEVGVSEIEETGKTQKDIMNLAFDIAMITSDIAKDSEEYTGWDIPLEEMNKLDKNDKTAKKRYLTQAEKYIVYAREAIHEKNKNKISTTSSLFHWLGYNSPT